MKKVLMITYDFPPARTSGIYRPVKFVKHLAKFGWEPVVLTVKNPYVPAYDHTLLRDIPEGTKIYASGTIDLAKVNDDIHKFLFGNNSIEPAPAQSRNSDSGSDSKPQGKSWLKRAILSPLNRFAINWIYLPDSRILWYPLVINPALKIIAREKPDVIYTTSFPPTTQIIGLTLKNMVGKSWVADFRDNWVVGFHQLYNSQRRVKFDRWLMGRIVKKADHVITMCEGNAKDIINTYNDSNSDKYTAITNGYDDDDFPAEIPVKPSDQSGKFRLLHMGTVYKHTAGLFFEALAEALEENAELKENLELVFVGYIFGEYRALISRLGLEKNVKILGFRPHPEAIREMIDSDVLLLFLGGWKILNQQFPGKFFEYLRCKRTILGVGQDGEIAGVLKKSGNGLLTLHDNKDQIKEAILNLYEKKKNNQLYVRPDKNYIEQFEYRNLAKKFAGVLDKVSNQAKNTNVLSHG